VTGFAVIGGGIAGVSAAAFLSPHGPVTLFESEPGLAYHTSGRSAAMLVEDYGSARARPLVKAARPFLENPPEGSVDHPLLSPRPVMWVSDPDSMPVLEERALTAQSRGARCVLVTVDDVMTHVPAMRRSWLGGGLFEPSGADIDVAGLHQAFVRIARRNGAEIRTSSPVTSIEAKSGRWVVASGDHRIDVDVLINASGAWGDVTAALAGVDPIGLQPMRRTAFMVPGSEASSRWPMVVEANEQFYFRPDGVQFLCSLAEEVPSDPMDARPNMEDVALAIERINEATTFDIRTVSSQWTGLRTFSPDRDLVIGEDPLAPGFFWLVGQGGIGIQTAPAYGHLLECLVTGKDLPAHFVDVGVDPMRTSPDRFRRT
jgi:D-arginine dehydrogenase